MVQKLFFSFGSSTSRRASPIRLVDKMVRQYRSPELLSRPWFHEVDVSKYIAYFILALNNDISVMMNAPAPVSQAQLEELSIQVVEHSPEE